MNKWFSKCIYLIINFFKKGKDTSESIDNQLLLHVTVATNVGKKRKNNEDNFFVDTLKCCNFINSSNEIVLNSSGRYVFAVCDGMGGESFGDEASNIAVSVLAKHVEKIKKTDISELDNLINMYVSEANDQICDMIAEKCCSRSGSTLAMICMDKTKVYAFNIGDSRVYYFNDNVLTQITEDQTLAMKKLKANIYTKEEAKSSLDAHKITSFLGVDNRRIGLTALSYEPFDIDTGMVLICSDGLTDMCSDEEIAEVLNSSNDNLANSLVNKALDNGGEDNVTCIVVQVSNSK